MSQFGNMRVDKNGNSVAIVSDLMLQVGYVQMLLDRGVPVTQEEINAVGLGDPSLTSSQRTQLLQDHRLPLQSHLFDESDFAYSLQAIAANPVVVSDHVVLDTSHDASGSVTGRSRARPYVIPSRRSLEPPADSQFQPRFGPPSGYRKPVKRLNLSAIVRDVGLQNSYGLTRMDISHVNMAIQASVEEAASLARDILLRKGKDVIVVADMSDTSRSVARAALRTALTDHKVPQSISIVADYVVRASLVTLFPPSGYFVDDDKYSWEISGPVREFAALVDVWHLVTHLGPHQTALYYGGDYSFLRIMITTVDRETMEANIVDPMMMRHHTGTSMDAWVDEMLATEYDLDGKIHTDAAVEPVSTIHGQVASALHVGEGWFTVPRHVLRTDGARIGNKPLVKLDVKILSAELFAVHVNTAVTTKVANTRAPKEDDRVSLRFCIDGVDKARVSVAMRASQVQPQLILPDVRTLPGMSGSPYVSSDGVVVALHDGASSSASVGVPMIDNVLFKCVSEQAWYSGGGSDPSRILSPIVRKWSSNKLSRERWTNLVRRMSASSLGLCVHDTAGLLVTTEQPGSRRNHGHILSAVFPYFVSEVDGNDGGTCALVTRPPSDSEMFVIVSHTGRELVLSPSLSYTELHDFNSHRSLGSGLVSGSLIIAATDVTVVGSYRRTAAGMQAVYVSCVDAGSDAITESSAVSRLGYTVGPTVKENRDWLKGRFGFLNAEVYSAEDLDEAFTHVSCGSYTLSGSAFSGYSNLGRIGDAVMKTRLHARLRKNRMPPSITTQYASKWQCNAVQATVAKDIGLVDQIRRETRFTSIGEHGLADALEALVAVVYLNDTEEILDKFLAGIAMFGDQIN